LLVYSLTFELYFFPKNIKDPSLSFRIIFFFFKEKNERR